MKITVHLEHKKIKLIRFFFL